LIANEMDSVNKEAENNGFIAVALNCTVFFLQRTDESICQVRRGKLEE
jgi:hypothetical protein